MHDDVPARLTALDDASRRFAQALIEFGEAARRSASAFAQASVQAEDLAEQVVDLHIAQDLRIVTAGALWPWLALERSN